MPGDRDRNPSMERTQQSQSPASPPSSLDRSLASGIAWTAVMRWLAQVFSWAATFYVARLLAPADYGLVAMAMLAIGLARMVEDFGMDAILVQDRTISGTNKARLAGLIVILGVALSGLFALFSYPIALFFHEPKLQIVIVVLSTVFITDALQVVPRAQLQRELQFRRLSIAALVQVVATQLALVTAATVGLGHWALVVNTLAGGIVTTLLLIYWSPFAVRWPRQMATLLGPLKQGWRILASRAAYYAFSTADQTVIGRMLGKDALGVYSFAMTFSTLPQQEIGSVVSRVAPGIFSEVQDRLDELRRYFLLLTELLAVISFPAAIGLALVADLFIPLLLGPKWLAVIEPLRLLCIYSAFLSSQLMVSHVLMWTGQFRVNMWCSILGGVAMPLMFLVAVDYGLEGIAWAWVLGYPLVSIPPFYFAFRTIGIRLRDWLDSLWPALAGCFAMAVGVLACRSAMTGETLPLAWEFTILVSLGAVAYVSVLWFAFRPRIRRFMALLSGLRADPAQGSPGTGKP